MSKPLGTCMFSSGPHKKFVWPICWGWKPLLPPSDGPATDALNQSIRDVTGGEKEIKITHPVRKEGGAN